MPCTTRQKPPAQRAHSLDGQIAQITHERQQYQAMMQQPDNARTLQQAENLNRLFDEKSFSWTLAMEDLETVLPGGVQVNTLEPTVKDGQITVRLRVVGPRDRDVGLVENLEHSRHFLLPRIVGETAESEGGPNQRPEPVSASNRVNFDMLADYTPGASEDRKLSTAKGHGKSDPDDAISATRRVRSGRSPYTGMARPRVPVQPTEEFRNEPNPCYNARAALFSSHLALRRPRRYGPARARPRHSSWDWTGPPPTPVPLTPSPQSRSN